MNDETPYTTIGDEPVEARIVSWVLGEASAFEAAELERLCEERPELLVFRRRMRALHGLLTEAEAAEEDEGWKLPPEKRKVLDEIFGEDPPELAEIRKEKRIGRSGRHAFFAIAACVMLAVVVLKLMRPVWLAPQFVRERVTISNYMASESEPACEAVKQPLQPMDQELEAEGLRGAVSGGTANALQSDRERVIVGGQVGKPGSVAFKDDMTLGEAVDQAGGANEFGSKKRVKVFRKGKQLQDDLTDNSVRDVKLQAGDSVEVPQKNAWGDGGKPTKKGYSGSRVVRRELEKRAKNHKMKPAAAPVIDEVRYKIDDSRRASTMSLSESEARPKIVAKSAPSGSLRLGKEDGERADSLSAIRGVIVDHTENPPPSGGRDGRAAWDSAGSERNTGTDELGTDVSAPKANLPRGAGGDEFKKDSDIEIVRDIIVPTEYDPPELPNSISASSKEAHGGGRFAVTPATPASFGETDDYSSGLDVGRAGEVRALTEKQQAVTQFRYSADNGDGWSGNDSIRPGSRIAEQDKVPALGDVPALGRLFEADDLQKAAQPVAGAKGGVKSEGFDGFTDYGAPISEAAPSDDGIRKSLLSQIDAAWGLALPKEQANKVETMDVDLFFDTSELMDSDKQTDGVEYEIHTGYSSEYLFKGRDLDGERSRLSRENHDREDKLEELAIHVEEPKPVPELVDIMEEIAASEDPYSTFSLNISDASFLVAQAALEKGEQPDPAGIKVEQFYNAVDYGDPGPSAGEPVAVTIEQCAHPVIPGRNLVRVALKTAAAGRSAAQPLRLTLLVDQSGSMVREDRRDAMDKALAGLSELLTKDDRVTVIGFSRTSRLLAEGMPGNEAGKLADLVNQAASEGGTNLEEAIRLAGEMAERGKLATAQNRIVLFTDGAANLGNADPERLAEKVRAMRMKGIAFDIAGIAADGLNDELLGELARNGNGRYYVVGKGAEESFAKQLAGAFRPAAENVKVQVRFNPERVGFYKLIGFEKDRLKTEDFRNDSVDAAELAAEEAGVAIYQVEPLPGGNGELGEVSVRFRDTAGGEMLERSWTIPHVAAPAIDRATPPMQLAVLSMLAGQKLRGGPLGEAIDFGRLSAPRAKVKQYFGNSGRVADMLRMLDALERR